MSLRHTEAVAEEFQRANAGARVTVGISGTGGGFQKFCRGRDGHLRRVAPDQGDRDRGVRQGAGVQFIELPVAYDGLAVVVNPKNTWATSR